MPTGGVWCARKYNKKGEMKGNAPHHQAQPEPNRNPFQQQQQQGQRKEDRQESNRETPFLRIDSNWKGPYGSAAAVPEPTAAAAIVDECLLLLSICDDDKPE